MPGGQIVLQPPPELQEGEGAGGVLMNAIPMLGSLGSIVLVATMGGANKSRSFLAAGMFLFATLGFIIVQIDRQRKQRAQQAAEIEPRRRQCIDPLAGAEACDRAEDAGPVDEGAQSQQHGACQRPPGQTMPGGPAHRQMQVVRDQ
jgi:hypothetical protein